MRPLLVLTGGDRQKDTRVRRECRQRRRSSEVFGKAAEHLSAILVDFLSRWRRAVLCQHAVARLERLAGLSGFGLFVSKLLQPVFKRKALCRRLRLECGKLLVRNFNAYGHSALP